MKTQIDKTTTVGDFVVQYPQLRQTLEQQGIDYCCGGKKPLGEAAEAAGKEWPAVEAALNAALAEQPEADTRDWNSAPLSELVDHIVGTHHAFMKEQLPRLDGLLQKVQKAHSSMHSDMLGKLRRAYDAIRSELEAHLMKEEQILFPLIKETEAFVVGGGQKPVSHCGSVANPIRQMEIEHDNAGNELAVMRKLTDGYQLPIDACQTFAALYEGLAAMEADLHEHIHLENNILFPKAVVQEAEMNNR
ncbi:iron-sulfur cluster repair di-iron protein [Pontiella sp.]|uniref:iron-sulfur cluster repair di-iron protein n=1 Tax=Pontiella sp. TaxID=2837462 RepID=UPI0035665722